MLLLLVVLLVPLALVPLALVPLALVPLALVPLALVPLAFVLVVISKRRPPRPPRAPRPTLLLLLLVPRSLPAAAIRGAQLTNSRASTAWLRNLGSGHAPAPLGAVLLVADLGGLEGVLGGGRRRRLGFSGVNPVLRLLLEAVLAELEEASMRAKSESRRQAWFWGRRQIRVRSSWEGLICGRSPCVRVRSLAPPGRFLGPPGRGHPGRMGTNPAGNGVARDHRGHTRTQHAHTHTHTRTRTHTRLARPLRCRTATTR